MKKLRGCLSVFLIFFFGAIVGAVITDAGARKKWRELVDGGPDRVIDAVASRLDEDLKLDDAQKLRLKDIVARTQIKLRQTREKVQPEVEENLRAAEEEVRSILYMEQVKKFDEIVQKGRQKWQQIPESGPAPAGTTMSPESPPAISAPAPPAAGAPALDLTPPPGDAAQ